MSRSLAHIEKIEALDPIEGADKIEVATVLGWKVVVKKNQFQVGDDCCYIELDSILPAIPFFEFMAPRKYRVKTIKLRGQISQGLIVSLYDTSIIRKELEKEIIPFVVKNGFDFTDYLDITKYESPSDREQNHIPKKKHSKFTAFMTRFTWYRKLTKSRSKSFPEWLSKTDETRLQNIPHILKDTGDDWYITEKIDGQSGTYWYKHGLFPEFGICSRNIRKFEWDNSNWSKVAKQFKIKEKLKSLKGDYALQGEIISPSIQKGIYYQNKLTSARLPYDFYVFNIYDIKEKKYLPYEEMILTCIDLNLKTVPRLSYKTILDGDLSVMINNADGESKICCGVQREGVVWRKLDQSVSFKVISNAFLLKKEKGNND